MRETIDRKGMSVLSCGHLATDFASGSVPALLPFFTVEVRSQLHAHGRSDARRARLVVADAAALRALVGPPWGALAASCRARARRRRDRARRRRAELRRAARPRLPLGHRDRRVPPGGREVRRLPERAQAGERDVPLQHRRQPRVRARADRRHAARALARARARRPAGAVPVVLTSIAVLGALPYLARRRPQRAAGAPASAVGQGQRRAMLILTRRDRAPERRLVRAAHVRAALGRVARQLGGRRQSPPLADAARGRGRHAAARPARGPVRAAPDAARRPGAPDADDPRLRPRRRRHRRRRA